MPNVRYDEVHDFQKTNNNVRINVSNLPPIDATKALIT